MNLVLILFLFLSLPGFAQEGDESLPENLPATPINIQAELKKLGHDNIDTSAMFDEKVILLMQKAIKQSPLHKNSPAEVREAILKQAEGSFAHDYLSNSPKLMNALVDVLRDDKALTSAMGIFLRKDDLRIYFFIWIGFMTLAWLFKKIFFKATWPKHRIKILGILVSLSFSAMSVTTFYNMFHAELSPAAKILFHHWRKRNL